MIIKICKENTLAILFKQKGSEIYYSPFYVKMLFEIYSSEFELEDYLKIRRNIFSLDPQTLQYFYIFKLTMLTVACVSSVYWIIVSESDCTVKVCH